MKISKSKLEQIVREELQVVLREMIEDKAGVVGADKENDNTEPDKAGPDMAPKKGADKDSEDAKEPEVADKEVPDEEVPAGDDPADTELSQDVADQDDEPEVSDEAEGGDIEKELVGSSIQSISHEKESKMMPNGEEIVIQFEDKPHPLRILLGKSGMIKFFYKGSIHNEL